MMKQIERMDFRQPRSARRYSLRRFGCYLMLVVLIASSGLYMYTRYMRSVPPQRNECVILLHGLYRSAASMSLIEHHLIREGYGVINIDYASTQSSITAIAEKEVASAVMHAKEQGYDRIHFVSHSLGALIIRTYLQKHRLPEGSRIVMLAPPNQGSELADWAYETFPRLSRKAGPAANQLGTRNQPFTSSLNPVEADIGIIIGNDSWNPLFSRILPGQDDGAVTVERAKLDEMCAFLIAPCNHTTILLVQPIRSQIVHFIQTGRFQNASQQ